MRVRVRVVRVARVLTAEGEGEDEGGGTRSQFATQLVSTIYSTVCFTLAHS